MLDQDIANFVGPPQPQPPLTVETLPMIRAGMPLAGRSLPSVEIDIVQDFDADGVPVRLYRSNDNLRHPLLVFLHGGGWLLGDLDTHDAMHRHLSDRAGCAVLAVGYRLAPENPFPAALDDVSTVWEWLQREAANLRIDPSKLALGGESAGGNLAAALTLRLRDAEMPQPAFQLLIHPGTDLRLALPSFDEVVASGLGRDYLQQCVAMYAGNAELTDPLVSPLTAASHDGLPRAIIITAEEDPLRDDGEYYAQALARSGVETLSRRLKGLPHGFLFLPITIPTISSAFDTIAGLIARYFAMR